MTNRYLGSVIALVTLVAVLSLDPVPAAGQAPTGESSSTHAAKPWTPPRTPDGQPDIQGFWASAGDSGTYDLEEGHSAEHAKITGSTPAAGRIIVDPANGKVPYLLWAAAKKKENFDNHTNPKAENIDPVARCFLSGVPRINYQTGGFQILQVPGYVIFNYEWNHSYRVIPLDGRPHANENVRLWMGDSRGRWEGKTLVIDVTNFTGKTWLDIVGTFHSDAMHTVERWTVVDADTIQYAAIIEDPKVYARPWKMAFPVEKRKEKEYELLEFACHEGNHSIENILGK